MTDEQSSEGRGIEVQEDNDLSTRQGRVVTYRNESGELVVDLTGLDQGQEDAREIVREPGLKGRLLDAEDPGMSSPVIEEASPMVGRARVSLTTDAQVARRDALIQQLDKQIAASKAPKKWFQRR